jgi:energy-coupling factor transport system substrate-specific component
LNPSPGKTPATRFAIPALAVAGACLLNAGLGLSVQAVGIPLYFDSLFSLVVVSEFGLAPGLLVAMGSNAILALAGKTHFAFVLCHLMTVVLAWLFMRRSASPWLSRFLWTGLTSALANGVAGSFISYFLFGGVTVINRIDDIVLGFSLASQSLLSAVFWAGMVTNLADKTAAALLAFWLVRALHRWPAWAEIQISRPNLRA